MVMEELTWLPFLVWVFVLLSIIHWQLDGLTKGLVCLLSIVSTFQAYAVISLTVRHSHPLHQTDENLQMAVTAARIASPIVGILLFAFLVDRFQKRNHLPDPAP